MTANGIDAVLPLTEKDLDRACVLFRSLERYFADLGTLWIVVPEPEYDRVSRRIVHDRYRVIAETEIIPEVKHFQSDLYGIAQKIGLKIYGSKPNGWFMQQIVKFAIAPKIESEYYLTFDADVICVRPTRFCDLVRDGRTFGNRELGDDYRPQWYEWSEPVLGLARSGFVHGVTPSVYSKEAVILMCKHLASRQNPAIHLIATLLPRRWRDIRSWRSYLLRNVPWTENCLYYTFLEATGLDGKYHFHLDGVSETIYDAKRSVWTPERCFEEWSPAEVFNNPTGSYFVVVQSNVPHVSTIGVWEKVRSYLV